MCCTARVSVNDIVGLLETVEIRNEGLTQKSAIKTTHVSAQRYKTRPFRINLLFKLLSSE